MRGLFYFSPSLMVFSHAFTRREGCQCHAPFCIVYFQWALLDINPKRIGWEKQMRKTISAVYHNCFRFLNKKNGVSPQGGAPLTTSFSVKQRPDCLHLSVLSDTFIRHSLNNIEFFGGTEACFDRLYASVSFWAVPRLVGLPFCANNIMYI